ncbi:MAG: ammonia-forming cytochrome c nitrite reductase subunit c552 [Coriobacteriales bacterium]|jgi:nitrite reductase (cytochrome c-552)|nr:ammonia-forming cytochrome c nitrite reductase subunit c552 [Coriobacteriales bacterium]
MKSKRLLILLFCLAITAVFVGCAQPTTQNDPAFNTEQTAPAPAYFNEFMRLYPDEYSSFVAGGLKLEDDGLVHSHAALRYRVETDQKLAITGAPCLSCKTAEFNTLYEQYGRSVFSMSYEEVTGQIVDYWSCRTCHENGDPYSGANATLVTFKLFGGDFAAGLNPREAACAQCHNSICDYARYIVAENERPLEEFKPYQYGIDADALRKAGEEFGVHTSIEPHTGIELFALGHPDIELFQGSTHQMQGLSCVDCHMPVIEGDQGQQFRNHDSSSSPIKNEAAMKTCLRCHSSQGVATTAEMRDFVREKQATQGALEDELLAKLGTLHNLITEATATGTFDEKTLQTARDAYSTAEYYLSFQHAGARSPGGKIAHAPTAMRDYLQKANDLANEAIASLLP